MALLHDLTVVTRNTGDVVTTGVSLLNPFRHGYRVDDQGSRSERPMRDGNDGGGQDPTPQAGFSPGKNSVLPWGSKQCSFCVKS